MNNVIDPEPEAIHRFLLSLTLEEQHGFTELITLAADNPEFYQLLIREPRETLAKFSIGSTSVSRLMAAPPYKAAAAINFGHCRNPIAKGMSESRLIYLGEESVSQENWTQAMLHSAFNQTVLTELDRRYWDFVMSLPSSQALLATDLRIAAGTGPSTPFRTIAQLGGVISLPWGFYDTFPQLDQGQLLATGETWLFVMLAMLLRDNLNDGQVSVSSNAVELQQQFMARARNILHSLVRDQISFWTHFEEYEHQVISGLQLEAQYRASPNSPYDITVAQQIGYSKLALCKTVPCVMAVLGDAVSLLRHLEFSLDSLAAGRQLLDDVVDWQEDLTRGHYTYPLIQAIDQLSSLGKTVSSQAISTEIANSIILEDTLHHAEAWHQQALAAVADIPCTGWVELLKHSMEDCVSYHRELVFHRIVRELNRDSTTNN